MRLIDAHDLWTEIMMLPHNGDMISGEEVEKAIAEAPTVDAVPVVRCKDCKHFDENNACYCHAADENGTPIFVREHDFCSYGERRDSDV